MAVLSQVPRDFTTLYDQSIFNINTSAVPDTVEAYKVLGVKHEPLKLINPQFETPLPPARPRGLCAELPRADGASARPI